MRFRATVCASLVSVFLVAAASGTTFLTLSDRQLLDRADAVVLGTVGEVASRATSEGILTDAQLVIDDVIKGKLVVSQTITITEFGGSAGGRTMLIVGAPVYRPGQRVLVFLKRTAAGSWYTAAMSRGLFAFGRNTNGEAVLIRDDDQPRLHSDFIQSLRGRTATASYVSPFPAATPPPAQPDSGGAEYILQVSPPAGTRGLRWAGGESGTIVFSIKNVNPIGVDTSSLHAAAAAWTAVPTAGITLLASGSTPAADPNETTNNTVFIGYSGALSSNLCDANACTVFWFDDAVTHSYGGDTFYSILASHVVFKPASYSQAQFDALGKHEFGHTIGLRHSNEGTPSTTDAIMVSTINVGQVNDLRDWDVDAVSTVYGTGAPCRTPQIVSTTNPGSVGSGTTATFTVEAKGTTPLSYQWYLGNSGDGSNPIGGATSTSYTTPPITVTKSFWVKVSNACGSANSATLTVSPQVCQPPAITTQPQSQTVNSGQSVTLVVGVSGSEPLSFQWYRGTKPDTSNPIATATSNFFTTSVTTTTSFWMRASNSCGSVDTDTATLSLASDPCTPPTLTLSPAGTSIFSPRAVVFVAAASGTSPITYKWYRGTPPDVTNPLTGLSTANNERWLEQVFVDLLGRRIDTASKTLFAGLSRSTAVNTILSSNEYRAVVVRDAYESFLGRTPATAETTYWTPLFGAGMTTESFTSLILGSPEYFAGSGGTNSGWVSRVYQQILGRAASAADVSFWLGVLDTKSRAATAELIIAADEARTRSVNTYFQRFLRRAATPAERSAFGSLLGGGSHNNVIATIVASQEYFSFPSVLVTDTISTNTSFWVQASNTCNSANSAGAAVNVNPCAQPLIVSSPSNVTVQGGASFTVGVAAVGTVPLSVQWYEGDKGDVSRLISGATSLAYSAARSAGTYKFWARVSSSCGSADSDAATVTVNCASQPPVIELVPATIAYNQTARLSWVVVPGVTYKFVGDSKVTDGACADNAVNARCVTPTGITADTTAKLTVQATVNCPSGPITSESSVVLNITGPPPAAPPSSVGVTSPLCAAQCKITQPFFVSGFTKSGKSALEDTGTFTLTVDRPFVTFNPSSGTMPPEGRFVDMIVDPAGLDIGSVGASVTVVRISFAAKAGVPTILDSTTTTVPISVSLVSPVTPKAKDVNPPANSLLIPAVAQADGAFGSSFRSDVRITNVTTAVQQYVLTYTPTTTNGIDQGRQLSLTIGPNDTKALDNIVKTWFGQGSGTASTTGTMEIRPVATSGGTIPNISLTTVAASRTYTTAQSGTFGQFIPALPLVNFLTKSDLNRISLQQVAQSAAYRTNIGVVEGSGEAADILLRLLDGNNRELAARTLSLRPFEHQQFGLAAFFGNVTFADGRVEVSVLSDTGKVSAYASTLDNKTNDPLLVFPVQPSQISETRYTVPGVAEFPTGANNFHTDMRVFNGGTTEVPITLDFSSAGRTPPASVNMTLQPGEVRVIDDTLKTLWNLSGVGGAVIVTTAQPSSLVVTARTYSRDANGGTLGQFIPGVASSEGVGLGERAMQVLQLEQSPLFRSNLGLFELTGQAVSVLLRAYTPESKVSALIPVDLGPGEFRQIGNIFAQMGYGNIYNGRITVEVTSGDGRVAAYGSNIDNRTQDPTYIPAQ